MQQSKNQRHAKVQQLIQQHHVENDISMISSLSFFPLHLLSDGCTNWSTDIQAKHVAKLKDSHKSRQLQERKELLHSEQLEKQSF